jgi:S1-C subfamily serine protease
MADIKRSNGHRIDGVLPIARPQIPGPHPTEKDVAFDLEAGVSAVRSLRSRVPADARTANTLGTEREGNAVLIDDSGLLLTIGYLISEATDVSIGGLDGREIAAQVAAYDHCTGFGLVRTVEPLDIPPLKLSSVMEVPVAGDPIVIASAGGVSASILGKVVERRVFAGSWEYMIQGAIFTVPMHPRWSGAALIDPRHGTLVGIGSLFVQEVGGDDEIPGNMFVPACLLGPVFDEMLRTGRAGGLARPWIGMHAAEALGHLIVSHLLEGGPADRADIRAGDIIQTVEGDSVETLVEMYTRMWAVGGPGSDIVLGITRGSRILEIVVQSADRHDFLQRPPRH